MPPRRPKSPKPWDPIDLPYVPGSSWIDLQTGWIDPDFNNNWKGGMGQIKVLTEIGATWSAAAGTISITPRGIAHIAARHFAGGAQSAGKSLFAAGEDISTLVKQAESVKEVMQAGGNMERIVDAGRIIGIDRRTGCATKIYTVITSPSGDLITAFPGVP